MLAREQIRMRDSYTIISDQPGFSEDRARLVAARQEWLRCWGKASWISAQAQELVEAIQSEISDRYFSPVAEGPDHLKHLQYLLLASTMREARGGAAISLGSYRS
jgi:hypothetical protein